MKRPKLKIKPVAVTKEGQELVIRMPLQDPVRSKSGKTHLVASTMGVLTTNARYRRRNVTIIATAYIERNEPVLKQAARASMARMAGRLK